MKFVDVAKFNKQPAHLQQLLKSSGVLPVTGVALKNWDAINEKDANGNRKYKYILNRGSSRSSKTFSLIDCIDRYCRTEKSKRCTVWRDTKTDCKKTVLNDSLRHFKATGRYKVGQQFNKTESIFTYTNDSTYEIHGTDDEETVHGLTQAVSWLNEPYKMSKDTFDQIDQRTEDFMFLDLNPKKGHWSDDLEKDPRCLVIHSTFEDNPLCPEESRNKILSYQPVSKCTIVLEKILTTEEAKAYDCEANPLKFDDHLVIQLQRCQNNEFKKSASDFNWAVYGLGIKAERPNRIFHFEEIPDEVFFKLNVRSYKGVDWGKVDPWGIIDVKYYDGALYLHELNYASENEIRSKLVSTELTQINAADEGIVKWKFGKLGIDRNDVIVCDSNRPLKIIALRDAGWEYAVAAGKAKGSVKDGIDLLNNMPVYYTASSVNIKYEQENYSSKIDNNGVILEEPEDIDNHLMDPARYVALFLQSQGIIRKV